MAVLALLLGSGFVVLYDGALGATRYPYYADSASYIEMAASLARDGHPRVTPWGLEQGEVDAVPQPLFPPGFPILTAALAPFTGDVRSAALIPSRVAAAALPLLLLLLWRGALSPAALIAVGVWVISSPGVREWQFLAYSDVLALALAIAALGAVARPLANLSAESPDRASTFRWLAAGFCAALCYTVRNAGLAVLVAAAGALVYGCLRGYIGRRAVALWTLGTVPPLAALATYNLTTFGQLQPYGMPPSARAWTLNVVDYARAQLQDFGLPLRIAESLPGVVALGSITLLLTWLLAAWWRSRHDDRRRHALLSVLGLYAVGGATLLVISRSRFEWPYPIDSRYALQYSFALALAVLIAAPVLLPAMARRVGGLLLVALLAANLASAAQTALNMRQPPRESWLTLAGDTDLIDAVRAIPEGTLIASNAAALFRVAAARHVRQLDVGGGDVDLQGSLSLLATAAGPRPATLVLVCNEWAWGFSACRLPHPSTGPACRTVRPAVPTVLICPVAPR